MAEAQLATLNSTMEPNVTTTDATPPVSQTGRYLMIGLGVLIIVVNLASIAMATRMRRQLQATVRYGIVSLCVSDFMTGLTMVMTRLWSSTSPEGRRYCQLQVGAALTSLQASCLTLVLLSLERCLATIKPIQFRVWVTKEKKLGALAGIWTISLLIGCLMFYEEPGDLRPKQACLVITYASEGVALAWLLITFTSFVAIFISYAVILLRLRKRRRQIGDSTGSAAVQARQLAISAQDRKSLTTIGVLVLLATVAYLPTAAVVAWIQSSGWYVWLPRYNDVFQVVSFLIVGSSLLNPLVYVWQVKVVSSLDCCRGGVDRQSVTAAARSTRRVREVSDELVDRDGCHPTPPHPVHVNHLPHGM